MRDGEGDKGAYRLMPLIDNPLTNKHPLADIGPCRSDIGEGQGVGARQLPSCYVVTRV